MIIFGGKTFRIAARAASFARFVAAEKQKVTAALYQMTASIAGIAEMIGKCTAAADSVNRYMRFLSSNESADRPAVSQEAGRRGGTKNSAGDGILKVERPHKCYGLASDNDRRVCPFRTDRKYRFHYVRNH